MHKKKKKHRRETLLKNGIQVGALRITCGLRFNNVSRKTYKIYNWAGKHCSISVFEMWKDDTFGRIKTSGVSHFSSGNCLQWPFFLVFFFFLLKQVWNCITDLKKQGKKSPPGLVGRTSSTKVHTRTERVLGHYQNHWLTWSIFFKVYPAAMSNLACAKLIVRQDTMLLTKSCTEYLWKKDKRSKSSS